jgi:hypothetical protein
MVLQKAEHHVEPQTTDLCSYQFNRNVGKWVNS